ncbi:MAG: tetratricopeptide repeat protein [Flavobacteriales bacterium]|nr:tetratricopeptide repeat protein [Flavobacteriales bacterium]
MSKCIAKYGVVFKRIFFLLLILGSSFNVFGQSKVTVAKVDSIINVANSTVDTMDKLNLLLDAYNLSSKNNLRSVEETSLLELIELYKSINLEMQAYEYSLKLEHLYDKNNDYYNIAKTKFDLGVQLLNMELFPNANTYFLDTEKLFNQFDDVDLKRRCLKYLGSIASYEVRRDDAIAWYEKSLQQAKRENNTSEIYHLYQLIGLEYQKSEKYDLGISYYNGLLGQISIDASKDIRGILHNNLGVLYSKKKDLENSEIHFKKALKLIEQKKEYADVLAMTNINLAVIAQKTRRQDEAINYTRKADYLSSISENEKLTNEVNFITANIYFYVSDYYNALLYVDKSIEGARKTNNRGLVAKALLFKSKIYGSLDNYEMERDFNSSYLQEESYINSDNAIHENAINSKRINIERIEKDALLDQKKSAEQLADQERMNAEIETQKARESKIIRDQALVVAQHEKDKSRLIEIERNVALSNAKRDSLAAVNALAQEEIAMQKSRSDSINTASAIQKQRVAEREADNANDILKRTYLIGVLLGVIILIVIGGMIRQRRLNNQISKERDKSDKLLLNILPKRIANELKKNSKVPPRKYEKVSVLFTDFVGFTKIAELLTEDELIEELDKYFNAFDAIIEKYNLEKIKTIGDSYMCAGGVPSPNTTNAFDAVKAGLEIAEYVSKDVEKKKAQGKPYWETRIGINTGSVIAGVVGSKKFAYDIWGDTVNIASRIESKGVVGFVNISESTYNEVKSDFKCVFRGNIDVKHKGEVPMYYVES